MIFNKDKWQMVESGGLKDFSLPGKVLKAANLAYKEFMLFSKGEWSLENYEICLSITHDLQYASFSFLPDPAYEVNGIPFEIADRGIYKNGRGVVYVYCLNDYVLVDKKFMR